MALLEVEIVRLANDAMDHYRAAYKERYGVEALFPGPAFTAGMTNFKDLIRKVGYERLTKMLSAYLKSDGENGWYKKMGHTLSTFAKNLEQINALAKETPAASTAIKMAVRSACSNKACGKIFLLEVMASEIGKTYNELCDSCKSKATEKWF